MAIRQNDGSAKINDDLFDDLLGDEPIEEEYHEEDLPNDNDPDEGNELPTEGSPINALESFLKEKGITDLNNIIFEDENGEEVVRQWSTLDPEEQLSILKQSELDNNYGLEDDEIGVINTIRESGLTSEEYINYIKQQAIQEFINSNTTTETSIDQYSDDELYVLDLRKRIDGLTDEEATLALEHDKANEALFTKKITALRNEYNTREEEVTRLQKEQEENEIAQQQAVFIESISDAISNFKTVGNFEVELEEEDKTYITDIIVGEDKAGVRHIAKLLNDPDKLVKMIWFATKGDEALEEISNHYKAKISEISKNKPKENKPAPKPSVFITKPKPKPQVSGNNYYHFDDED